MKIKFFVLLLALLAPQFARADEKPQLFGVQKGVLGIEFSPDGKLMLADDFYYSGQIWDVASRRPLWKTAKHLTEFSPNGKFMFRTLMSDYSTNGWPSVTHFQLVDAKNGYQISSLSDPTVRSNAKGDYPVAFTFSKDGSSLMIASAFHLRVWEVPSGKLLRVSDWKFKKEFSIGGVHLLADFSPDGKELWDFGVGGTIFDVETGIQGRSLHLPSGDFYRFSPDGRSLWVSVRNSERMRAYNSQSGQLLWEMPSAPAYPSDGKSFYVVDKGIPVLYKASTGQEIKSFLQLKGVRFTVAPDGNSLYEARDGKIWKWRAR